MKTKPVGPRYKIRRKGHWLRILDDNAPLIECECEKGSTVDRQLRRMVRRANIGKVLP